MRRKTILSIAALALLAVAMLSASACKTSGMAVTSRGQFLKINIEHPNDLPEQGVDNLDIQVSNMGVNNLQNVLLEVELPPQLFVVDQTTDRGINSAHDPGTNMHRFTFGNIQAGERSTVRFRVRTSFGSLRQTGDVKVTAWQEGLPGDKLVETAIIKLRE
jgi:hypothetical protein